MIKWTIDRVALAAVIVSVAANLAVVGVAVSSVAELMATGERVSELLRAKSHLEGLRFASASLDGSQQAYVITGNPEDLRDMLSTASSIDAEFSSLAHYRKLLVTLDSEYATLGSSIAALVAAEKRVAEVRRQDGFNAAQAKILRQDEAAKIQADVLAQIYRMIAEANKQLDRLELERVKVSTGVNTWLVILISATAVVLVTLYFAFTRLTRSQRLAQAKLTYQAEHDSLTGLHNRQAVIDHLNTRLSNADTERALGGFTLMLIDLDGFKAVNDQLGHDAGDAVLRTAASRMRKLLRDDDFIARLGGDEFLVVIPQVSDVDTASLIGEKLIAGLSAPFEVESAEKAKQVTATPPVSASIGVSFFPAHAVGPEPRESLMRAADNAMYEAKRAGRNRVAFFSG